MVCVLYSFLRSGDRVNGVRGVGGCERNKGNGKKEKPVMAKEEKGWIWRRV